MSLRPSSSSCPTPSSWSLRTLWGTRTGALLGTTETTDYDVCRELTLESKVYLTVPRLEDLWPSPSNEFRLRVYLLFTVKLLVVLRFPGVRVRCLFPVPSSVRCVLCLFSVPSSTGYVPCLGGKARPVRRRVGCSVGRRRRHDVPSHCSVCGESRGPFSDFLRDLRGGFWQPWLPTVQGTL